MAERLKDETDRMLESLFRSETVRNDGFSARVVSRVRRRMWVQRLSLPTAFVVGVIFAAKPILELMEYIPQVLGMFPRSVEKFVEMPVAGMPQLSTIVLGVMLLAAAMMIGRMLEE